MMGTEQDSVKPEKGKVLSKKKNGFWFRIKLMFSCISSRSKVDSSTLVGNNNLSSSLLTKIPPDLFGFVPIAAEPKPVIEKREGDPPSCPDNNGSTKPLISGELKYSSKLRIFMFNDLKLATRNFRPESLLGEGGFGCVFKGWIEENGTAPVKPGTGLTVAVKTLNPDGLQGHKEWLVMQTISLP